jgi:hypothetical protein
MFQNLHTILSFSSSAVSFDRSRRFPSSINITFLDILIKLIVFPRFLRLHPFHLFVERLVDYAD